MAPNIVDQDTWQRAERLMQPIFIRLMDHFRKILEDSPWKGDYQQREIWPDSIPESVKQRRQDVITQLAIASSQEEVARLEIELDTLPTPYPGYELHLYPANEDSERSPHTDPATPIAVFDLWEICYHICFTNYPLDDQDSAAAIVPPAIVPAAIVPAAIVPAAIVPAAIVDVHLLDEDGEVDWQQVDQKTSRVVQHLFNTAESR